jgi:hypothetical protein
MCGIAGIILLSSQGNCIALGDFVEDCFLPLYRSNYHQYTSFLKISVP